MLHFSESEDCGGLFLKYEGNKKGNWPIFVLIKSTKTSEIRPILKWPNLTSDLFLSDWFFKSSIERWPIFISRRISELGHFRRDRSDLFSKWSTSNWPFFRSDSFSKWSIWIWALFQIELFFKVNFFPNDRLRSDAFFRNDAFSKWPIFEVATSTKTRILTELRWYLFR